MGLTLFRIQYQDQSWSNQLQSVQRVVLLFGPCCKNSFESLVQLVWNEPFSTADNGSRKTRFFLFLFLFYLFFDFNTRTPCGLFMDLPCSSTVRHCIAQCMVPSVTGQRLYSLKWLPGSPMLTTIVQSTLVLYLLMDSSACGSGSPTPSLFLDLAHQLRVPLGMQPMLP